MNAEKVQPGTPGAAIVDEEEHLLARVGARVVTSGLEEAAAPSNGSVVVEYERELIELRDQISEAKPEDLPPLVEQMMRLQAIAARRGRSRALPVDTMAPYFAHIRLREPAASPGRPPRERDVLIGKRGFIDRAGGINIVDWRNAPVSKIYYRYEEGDDYDENFEGGRLEGVVTARRNLSIVQGRLRRIGCPQGTFVRDTSGAWLEGPAAAIPTLQGGQGSAARPPRPQPQSKHAPGSLGGSNGRADRHLPEIAALIDQEQFELISRPDSGLVVIQGGAGSGKTTVALHRVAFLAFHDPRRFRGGTMLVVVPAPALARYVEGVLPSLGVNGVPVVTKGEWAAKQRRKLVPAAGHKYDDGAADAVLKVKKHPALLGLLNDFVARQTAEAEAKLPAAALSRWKTGDGDPLVRRLSRLIAWIGKSDLPPPERIAAEGTLRQLRRRALDVVLDWEELFTDEDALRAGFAKHCGPGTGAPPTAEELHQTARHVIAQRQPELDEELLGTDPERLEAIDDGLVRLRHELETYGVEDDEDDDGSPKMVGGDGPAEVKAPRHDLRLDPEDDPILLRLWQLKMGGLVERKKKGHTERKEIRYEHIAIDEAQDYSAIELAVLLDATTEQRSVTVAGDTAQRLVFDNGFVGWAQMLKAAGYVGEEVGGDEVEVAPLRLSYRSTAEIMTFARAVLGDLADQDAPLVARNGAPIELFKFNDMGEGVAFLGEALSSVVGREPTASIALVTRYPEQADAWFKALHQAEVPALRLVKRQDFVFAPGVDVTDVTQVKGLEWDYVVMLDVGPGSYPDTVEARHMMHIASTRAAHQLWLVTTGAPSPLLPDWLLSDDEGVAAPTKE